MHAHQLYDLQESMRAMSASKAEKMVNAGVANTDASAVTTALEHTRREAAELRLRLRLCPSAGGREPTSNLLSQLE